MDLEKGTVKEAKASQFDGCVESIFPCSASWLGVPILAALKFAQLTARIAGTALWFMYMPHGYLGF